MTDEKVQGTVAATMEAPAENLVQVTFLPEGKTVTFEHGKLPYKDHGQRESLLDVALNHGIHLDHACGGNCACTTCHVVVKQGMENLSPMQQDEEDRLDIAEGLTLSSRLGCQAVVKGDVVAEIMEEGEAGH
jgi:2Fe-2S ferredoxin